MEGRGNNNMKTGQPLELLFEQFAKFGDTHKTGDSITLKNVDKWFRQAQIINCKSFTSADISVTFSKLAKNKKSINYVDFLNFIDALSDYTKANADDIKSKLRRSGAPSANNPTRYESKPIYDRLTDATKYTGIHKKRFDSSCKLRAAKSKLN